MKKIFNYLFSMELTVILLSIFAFSAGFATIIENDFGTTAAQIAVYKAFWFEFLLVLLAVNLAGSLIVNKFWANKKYVIFFFHLSFIIILIGAGITRYFGFEGSMHIRQGMDSNYIVTDQTYISAKFDESGQSVSIRKPVLMADYGKPRPSFSFDANNQEFEVKTLDFVPNATVEIIKAPEGFPVVSMMVMEGMNRRSITLKENETADLGNFNLTFNNAQALNTANLMMQNGSLFLVAPFDILSMSMDGQAGDTIKAGQITPFLPRQIYNLGGVNLVVSQFESSAAIRPVRSPKGAQTDGADALVLEVKSGNERKEVIVWGEKGAVGETTPVKIAGQWVNLSYGSVVMSLPFKIKLNKFILERYPGSKSPSSYASEVTLIDESQNKKTDFRIYMNHILKHRGYRFYQSSYDNDEKGTILSVNHDGLGTAVSYFGYALMSFGMIFALFSKRSRFSHTLRKIGETHSKRTSAIVSMLIPLMLISATTFGASETKVVNGVKIEVVDKDHAAKFAGIIVLGTNGRLEPVNTLSSKLLRKFSGKSTWEGLNSDQVFIGIISQPEVWRNVPLIKVTNKDLQKILNINSNYAAFTDFFDQGRNNNYLLGQLVDEAYKKKPADQTRLDKEIIKADEKVNVFYLIYSGSYLTFFPKSNDPIGTWFKPADEVVDVPAQDSIFIKNATSLYVEALHEAFVSGNYSGADQIVNGIKMYQNKYAGHFLASNSKLKIEMLYNKADIFERLFKFYGLFGVLFLVLLFVNLVQPKIKIELLNKIFIGILSVAFLAQTLGMAARWYISGHAPMSNGYESMVFISWATMLAGFILVKKSNIALAATTVLASLTLMVAHLNWMNPEVTNLVPVLKSVWLTIHVAIITSSYGFFGLGAILGLFNLMLMIFQNKKNLKSFDLTIREISLTTEATLTIGLYMLTIGTFLGGVWANESWGRYWGWDPKETWALVTVLVYAIISHLNFIPGAVGRYLFNAMAVLGFSSVLMTYFGVNYYLSGLHSYASGDPVPIPDFVYYSMAILGVILVLAFINNNKMKELTDKVKK